MTHNYGVVNHGSLWASGGMAVGPGSSATHHHHGTDPTGSPRVPERVDIGLLTVKAVETQAVVTMLARLGEYQVADRPDGIRLHRASVPASQRLVEVAALQIVEPGQRSATLALERFRQLCCPTVVAVVGIAGGIHPSLKLGDVVVADEVIYYDLRKETGSKTIHRGQIHRSTVPVRRRLNNFFSERGEPCVLPDPVEPARSYQVLVGPIGSGEAVVASDHAEIREYLGTVNDKVLAVETEVGGVAQACYEAGTENGPDWLTIRGISDLANHAKTDDDQPMAAQRAAAVFAALIPYLVPAS